MRIPHDQQIMSRDPIANYGSLEHMIRQIREHRPLDLNAEIWRNAHPGRPFDQWEAEARQCLNAGLHYDPGPLDLQAEILDREENETYIREYVMFNTTPWNRVSGYFLYPKGLQQPVPGIAVLHDSGGPILFGKERMVDIGRDHEKLAEHRIFFYGGRYLADEYVKQGYAVLVIDAHHFGDRAPRGVNGIPESYDPMMLIQDEFNEIDKTVKAQFYLGVRQLNWAGTTWMGLNYWDDSRSIDYLLSRSEVDGTRIGCTGLSGGGWRSHFLAALDTRIAASVSVGWMTTGDYQQIYNVAGAIGTCCLLPGVWNRMDVPDLTILSVPRASMLIVGSEDHLFPPEAQVEAVRQIQKGFEWAGCPDQFRFYHPSKPHCYDVDIQERAFDWFRQHFGK